MTDNPRDCCFAAITVGTVITPCAMFRDKHPDSSHLYEPHEFVGAALTTPAQPPNTRDKLLLTKSELKWLGVVAGVGVAMIIAAVVSGIASNTGGW